MRGLGKEYGMGPRYPVVPRFACVRFHILCLKKHQKIFSFDICIFTGTVAAVVSFLAPMTQLSPSTRIHRAVKRYLEEEP